MNPGHETGVYTASIDMANVQPKLSLYHCDCTLANRISGVSSVSLSTISSSVFFIFKPRSGKKTQQTLQDTTRKVTIVKK